MRRYGSNKLNTAIQMRQRIANWPTAWDLRIRRRRRGLRMLNFREGLNLVCRGGTRDWDVVHELMFAGSYHHALEYVRNVSGPKLVLDLGGNLGLFSLMAASQAPDVQVHAFEPGPPNQRLFEMNRLGNYPLGERITLHREAVGGSSRVARWFFDEYNPGASSLYGAQGGACFDVKITSLNEVMKRIGGRVTLAKIDIEGAEFEILQETPPEVWSGIDAISLELHDDPAGKMSQEQFMHRMAELGFRTTEEKVCTYFLQRA